MKSHNVIYLIVLINILLQSCSEDRLKPDPLSFFTPQNVFVDFQGFEAALTKCRKDLNSFYEGEKDNYESYEVAFSDLAVELRESDYRKITPSYSLNEASVITFFNQAYKNIKNANTIITRIKDFDSDDENAKNLVLSKGYWFRAFWYYLLINTYGDIPWSGNEVTDARLDYQTVSRMVIVKKLIEDLEFAKKYLPEKAASGYLSQAANSQLLAKLYLCAGEFDKAISETTEIIEGGNYSLMTERFGEDISKEYHNLMWDLHRPNNKNASENRETILTTIERPDAPLDAMYNTIGTYTMRRYSPSYWKITDSEGARATNWTTEAGDTLGIGNGDVRTNDFWHYWIWEDETYNFNTTPDMRRSHSNWIEMGRDTAAILTAREDSPEFGRPLTKLHYANLHDTIDTWYPWPYNKIYIPTPHSDHPNGGQSDMYIYRLAGTYLLRAEAYAWEGKLELAVDDINKVRARAHAPLISSDEVSIDYIFDERARELYIEEPRHAEMVRATFIFALTGKDGYNMENISSKNWFYDRVMAKNPHYYGTPLYEFWGNTAHIDPFNFLWPIPQSVITANTLGHINQNVGYQGYENNVLPLEEIPED